MANFEGAMYAEYIDWRVEHPSDDLMTALLNVEFEDEHRTVRKLTREEILTFVTLLSGAGNDTTAKLIGWTGKLLSDHPDQRKELVEDPSLVPDAVEELLRYQPPGMQNARYVTEDVEFSGGTVRADTVVVTIMASANHDEARFPDAERFDIHRKPTGILTFAFGIHFCLGAALGATPGPRCDGRGAEALPGVDRGRRPGGAAPNVHHPRLRLPPGGDLVDHDGCGPWQRWCAFRRSACRAPRGRSVPDRPRPVRR